MFIHIILTGVLIGMGIILLLPGDTFRTGIGWRLFAESGTEENWAIAFFLGALAGASGIATSHNWLKICSIMMLATAHLSIAFMFVWANPLGVGSILCGGNAALAYYLAFRQVPWPIKS